MAEDIRTLDELHALCHSQHTLEVTIAGREVKIPVNKLTPRESAELALILEEALPPLVEGAKPGEEHYDLRAREYREAMRQNQIIARALAVYRACPLFHVAHPGLKRREDIVELVQSKLTDDVVDLIYQVAARPVVSLSERVNFS